MIGNIGTNPAFVGVVIALPSAWLGYLGYKRSQKVDAVAAQAGIATVESGSIGQVIEGQNKLVANLQADNKVLRDIIDELNSKMTIILARCEELKQQVQDLANQVAGIKPTTEIEGST